LKGKVGIKNGVRKSQQLWKQATALIPCGTNTFSKMASQFVEGVYPIYIKKGQGCIVEDVDGNKFIDYPLSLGPIILGHNYPKVNAAISDQLKKGIVFSLPGALEVELSKLIKENIPSAQMVRFVKTGSEATSAAIRIARAYMGKSIVAQYGYHGWHEWFTAGNKMFCKGIPEEFKKNICSFQYNDIKSLEALFKKHKNKIACVIMEPVALDLPKNGFLKKVQALAHKNNALVIFDETITGFRFSKMSVQKYYNVTPDISILGKGIANGMPLGAVVGKKKIMDVCHEIFFSSTFAGELLSLSAAVATIEEIKRKNVCAYIDKIGTRLKDGFNTIADELGIKAQLNGYGGRHFLVFSHFKDANKNTLAKSLFWQETVKRGVLFGAAQYVSYAHTKEMIDYTLDVSRQALSVMKKAINANQLEKALKGKPVRPAIRLCMSSKGFGQIR
jgi:glutamate-1-semialdehyde-2,1-aminomutase|tara:strand:+ start:2919 stop:4256 length:1338 start_codon:yes stop_codon:yes gene_type:complete